MFADADWDGGGSISATEWCVYLGMPSGGKRAKLSQIAEQARFACVCTVCVNTASDASSLVFHPRCRRRIRTFDMPISYVRNNPCIRVSTAIDTSSLVFHPPC